jgi:magnesium transporter
MNARASVVSNNLNVLMKRLTVINVVFMPLNVIAGICGMSEFTMMTHGVAWPIAYGIFVLGLTVIGLTTYWMLRLFEQTSLRDGNKMTR